MSSLRRILILAVLLVGAVSGRAGVSYEVSPAFAFDTRDYLGGLATESTTFAFDTRASDGLSGSRTSGIFGFDTRSVVATGLAIVGPGSVTRGSQTEYHVVMNAPGGGTTDVTANAFLAFVGGAPTYAGIGGTTLFVLRSAPAGASVQLIARYQNAGGQVLSAPLTVTIGTAFFAGMTATASHTSGANYTISLNGTASGGTAPYTYRWDTNPNTAYDDALGQTASFTKTSADGGTFPMKLEVTDATNAKAYARGSVTLNRAPSPGPSLSTSIVPPCSSTRLRTSVRPMPSPPCDRSSELCACTKRSNTRGSISGVIPMPSSRTRTTVC